MREYTSLDAVFLGCRQHGSGAMSRFAPLMLRVLATPSLLDPRGIDNRPQHDTMPYVACEMCRTRAPFHFVVIETLKWLRPRADELIATIDQIDGTATRLGVGGVDESLDDVERFLGANGFDEDAYLRERASRFTQGDAFAKRHMCWSMECTAPKINGALLPTSAERPPCYPPRHSGILCASSRHMRCAAAKPPCQDDEQTPPRLQYEIDGSPDH
jgi:hypothetical protein